MRPSRSFDRKYFKFLKFQDCEIGARGFLRKILRKPAEAYGNPTETLQKSYGNPTEILERFSGKILRKSYGSLRKSYGSLRKLPQTNSKNSGSSFKFFLRKRFLPYGSPVEALRSPAEVLRKLFSKIKITAEASAGA